MVTSVDAVSGDDEVEVAHEALIRYWPALHGWLTEDRTLLRIREGVRRAAQEWLSNGTDDSFLVHRGKRLDTAQPLKTHPRLRLNEREQRYLDACEAVDDRHRNWEVRVSVERQTPDVEPQAVVIRLRRMLAGVSGGDSAPTPDVVQIDHSLQATVGDASAYGQALGRCLFQNAALADAVATAAAAADARKTTLRIAFQIDDSTPELHRIRWEALALPGVGEPLACTEGVTVVRLLATPARLRGSVSTRTLVLTLGERSSASTGLELPASMDVDFQAADGARSGEAILSDDYRFVVIDCDQDRPGDLAALPFLLLGSDPAAVIDTFSPAKGAQPSPAVDQQGMEAVASVVRGLPSCAVVVVPAGLAGPARDQFLVTLVGELLLAPRVDDALVAARRAVSDDPSWWAPAVFAAFTSCRVWYFPGFQRESSRTASKAWSLLDRAVLEER